MSAALSTCTLLSGWAFPSTVLAPLAASVGGEVGDLPVPSDSSRVIGGWSLGGLRSLEAVFANPSAWRACVLISSTACFSAAAPDWPGQPRAALRALQRQFARSPRQALDVFHRLTMPAPPDEAIVAARVATSLAMSGDALVAGLETLASLDLRENLFSCDKLVLILHGAKDQVIPLVAAEALARLLPRATLEVHPVAAHDLPLTHHDWVADRIRNFLEQTS
jgi:pimeloyl-[acyl-carrier protein] methyl ester esterase